MYFYEDFELPTYDDDVSEILSTASLQYGSESVLDQEVQSPFFREESTTTIMELPLSDPYNLFSDQPFDDSLSTLLSQGLDSSVSNWKDTLESVVQSPGSSESIRLYADDIPYDSLVNDQLVKSTQEVNEEVKKRKTRGYADKRIKAFMLREKEKLLKENPCLTLKEIGSILEIKIRERFPKEISLDILTFLYNSNRKNKY